MRKPHALFALVPMIVLLGSMPALAESVTVNIVDPLSPGLGIGHGDNLSYSFNGQSQGLPYAGVFNTQIVNSFGQTSSTFDTYCIDLYHDFGGPVTHWTAMTGTSWNVGGQTDPSNPGQANIGGALAYLVDLYDPAVVAALNAHDSATANLDAAALQIALWSVEYNGTSVKTDDASNTAAGRFYFGAGDTFTNDIQSQVYAKANSDIASILLNTGTALFYTSERDAASQDLIGPANINFPLGIVPEPSSIAMMAVGLVVVGLRARKSLRPRRDA